MCEITIVLIQRAARFSPNNVENDQRILACVFHRLKDDGYCLYQISEDEFDEIPEVSVYLSMARGKQMLSYLADQQAKGKLVVNSSEGVDMCNRRAFQMQLLEQNGLPVAPKEGTAGYWVKRGDSPATAVEDVVFAGTKEEAMALREKMLKKGVPVVDLRAHVPGDLIKFYGVCGTEFFRYYYPGDDGYTKFGHERRNGCPVHYPFDEELFRQTINRAAALLQLEIYGGDAVIRSDGSFSLVDFNDWPSFSRCREEAAQAIVDRLGQLMKYRA